jgi:serine/threonine-protein kinase
MAEQGKLEEAEGELRQAIRLKPDLQDPHLFLGNTLLREGKLDDAVVSLREAIRLKPDDSRAHLILGHTLGQQEKYAEAADEFREAVRLKPDHLDSHRNLGVVLAEQGMWDEAVAEFRKARDLAKGHPDRSRSTEMELAETEQRAALARRLPALLRGEDKPGSAAEGIVFAWLSYSAGRFVTSARLFASAFQADPRTADDRSHANRYQAACAAAQAGAGDGAATPDGPLADKEKARWRKQAVEWLQAELSLVSLQMKAGTAPTGVVPTLRHWKEDSALSGIRDEAAVKALPEDEQKACRALWAELDRILESSRPR